MTWTTVEFRHEVYSWIRGTPSTRFRCRLFWVQPQYRKRELLMLNPRISCFKSVCRQPETKTGLSPKAQRPTTWFKDRKLCRLSWPVLCSCCFLSFLFLLRPLSHVFCTPVAKNLLSSPTRLLCRVCTQRCVCWHAGSLPCGRPLCDCAHRF